MNNGFSWAINTDRPISSFNTVNKGKITVGKELKNIQAKAILRFSDANEKPVLIKVGLSSASIEGAVKSIEKEIPNWDFEKTRKAAEMKWEKELSKIKVTTTDTTKLRIFYTALYHCFTAPNLHSDLNGEYKGLNGEVNKTGILQGIPCSHCGIHFVPTTRCLP